jgi:hypothetical protein
MRELIYTLLELERTSRKTCDFCSNPNGDDNKSIRQIVTRIKANSKYVADDVVCENCEEKFLNGELFKCERCGRLQAEHNFSFRTGKYICDCIRYNENLEEKELPSVPYESQATFYERQINKLQEEKTHLAVEAQTHLDAMEAFEVWNKEHRQQLLDRIRELEEENKRLKGLTNQELVREIEELKEQVEQLSKQQTAQIEVLPKDKGIKGFFKFGGKK